LDELLQHDGRGGQSVCIECQAPDACFKCLDCSGCRLHCARCLVHGHQHLPLHRISVRSFVASYLNVVDMHPQEWKGSHFQRTSLRDLGLVVSLGHNGNSCPSRGTLISDFVVVDTSGIHHIALQFCECYHDIQSQKHHIQLLRFCWMPATSLKPRTAFTFSLLEMFQLLTAQSKISAYDYYLSILRRTNNSKHIDVDVCSFCFCFCIVLTQEILSTATSSS
jgi:hypothetical protein